MPSRARRVGRAEIRHHVAMGVQHIVSRDGPAGARAALRDGPDVWEVIATFRAVGNRLEPTARHLGLSTEQVEAALAAYRADSGDVDARIRSELELAERAYREWASGRDAT